MSYLVLLASSNPYTVAAVSGITSVGVLYNYLYGIEDLHVTNKLREILLNNKNKYNYDNIYTPIIEKLKEKNIEYDLNITPSIVSSLLKIINLDMKPKYLFEINNHENKLKQLNIKCVNNDEWKKNYILEKYGSNIDINNNWWEKEYILNKYLKNYNSFSK